MDLTCYLLTTLLHQQGPVQHELRTDWDDGGHLSKIKTNNYFKKVYSLNLHVNDAYRYHVAWKFCRFKFLLILWIDLDPQKLVPAEKTPENKTPQKWTPFSQIKNMENCINYWINERVFCCVW